jgi:PqqD family protein of HPr-rel-A system
MTDYRIPEYVLAAYPGEEAVLLQMESKRYFRLSATAARVFQDLQRAMSAEAIVADLCAEFAVTPEVARTELEQLLEALSARGLITSGSAAA